MDRDQFIELVRQRAGAPASRRLGGMPLPRRFPRPSSEPRCRSSRSGSAGEARDIARQPPPPLDEWLQPEREKSEPVPGAVAGADRDVVDLLVDERTEAVDVRFVDIDIPGASRKNRGPPSTSGEIGSMV
jgi:hypothetical protein